MHLKRLNIWLLRGTHNGIWLRRWDQLPHDQAESQDRRRLSTFRWYRPSDRASCDNKHKLWGAASTDNNFVDCCLYLCTQLRQTFARNFISMDVFFIGHSYIYRLRDHYLLRPVCHRSYTCAAMPGQTGAMSGHTKTATLLPCVRT